MSHCVPPPPFSSHPVTSVLSSFRHLPYRRNSHRYVSYYSHHVPPLQIGIISRMDEEKKPSRSSALNKFNNNMYMTFKEILRQYALRYLPAKSLYRCNAVCKDWKLFISSPFFEHSQSYFSRSLSGLFAQIPGGPIFFVSLDPTAYGVPDPEMKFLPEPVDLLVSSNGLLCLRGRTEPKAYYICNPANQQWKELPKPEADHGSIPAIVLVFEPSLLKFEADYQLICAFPSPNFQGAYEFEIYSSIDNSWKFSSEICFSEEVRVLDRNGVHLNGIVYWLSNDDFLLGIDLKNSRATLTPCDDFFRTRTLGVIDGKPCTSRRIGPELIVSTLSNVHGTTKQMSSVAEIWKVRSLMLQHADLSSDIADDQDVLTIADDLIVFHDRWAIFSYNLKTKETVSFGPNSEVIS